MFKKKVKSNPHEPAVKKGFMRQALTGQPIFQSMPVDLHGESYWVIGHKNFGSPFYTYFDVLNVHGERLADELAVTVYQSVSMIELTEFTLHLIDWWQVEGDSTEHMQIIHEQLKQKSGVDVLELLNDKQHLVRLYQSVIEEAHNVLQSDRLQGPDMIEFQVAWDQLWDMYEERLPQLLTFRAFIVENHLTDQLVDPLTQSLLAEANMMYHLFMDAIPTEHPLVHHMNELIQLNYKLGRVDHDKKSKIVKPKEKLSYQLFKYGTFFAFVLLPVTFWSLFTDEEGYKVFIGWLILTTILVMTGRAKKFTLMKHIDKRLKTARTAQLSSAPDMQTDYKSDFKISEEKVSFEQPVKPYAFTGSLVRVARWILGMGLLMMVSGQALLRETDAYDAFSSGYIILAGGAIIALIGFFIPKWNIAKRTIELQQGKLVIGDETYTREDIISLQGSYRFNRIKVYFVAKPKPITYKLEKTQTADILSHLKSWSNAYFVPYKE